MNKIALGVCGLIAAALLYLIGQQLQSKPWTTEQEVWTFARNYEADGGVQLDPKNVQGKKVVVIDGVETEPENVTLADLVFADSLSMLDALNRYGANQQGEGYCGLEVVLQTFDGPSTSQKFEVAKAAKFVLPERQDGERANIPKRRKVFATQYKTLRRQINGFLSASSRSQPLAIFAFDVTDGQLANPAIRAVRQQAAQYKRFVCFRIGDNAYSESRSSHVDGKDAALNWMFDLERPTTQSEVFTDLRSIMSYAADSGRVVVHIYSDCVENSSRVSLYDNPELLESDGKALEKYFSLINRLENVRVILHKVPSSAQQEVVDGCTNFVSRRLREAGATVERKEQ